MKSLSSGMRCVSILAIIVSGAFAGNAAAVKKEREYWPTQAWQSSPPEKQGIKTDVLKDVVTAITEKQLPMHSILIVRNGYLVAEKYFGTYHEHSKHLVYSVTKSVVSALVGIAIDKGYLMGVDQPVLTVFPEHTITHDLDRKRALTVEHLLTMQSGLEWKEMVTPMHQSSDWVQFVLDLPLVPDPGTTFNYCSGNMHLLSAMIGKTADTDTLSFARTHLFEPLGISDIHWQLDPQGIPNGGWGLWMRPRDMAKIGYLYLNNGVWDGQQLLSAKWVEQSQQKHVLNEGAWEPWDEYYGYGWWVHEIGAYAAHGYRGQFIYVIPHLDMVVVMTGGLEDSQFVEPELIIRDIIMTAVEDN